MLDMIGTFTKAFEKLISKKWGALIAYGVIQYFNHKHSLNIPDDWLTAVTGVYILGQSAVDYAEKRK